jgi:hypothetical protein
MDLFEGGQNLIMLGMIPGGLPFGQCEVEAAYIFGLGDDAFFHKHAGEPVS